MRKLIPAIAAAACSLPLALVLMASDHRDGPNTTADPQADITDLYAWHDASAGTFTVVLSFNGLRPPGQANTYDPNVVYAVHLTSVNPAMTSQTLTTEVDVRFAQNAAGGWGVQMVNCPGTTAPISGPVETTLTQSGVSLYTGLRDDPFFFDLDGFHATVQTGNLDFNNAHDTFAGTNVSAIVIQIPLTAVTVGGTQSTVKVWASTGRLPDADA